jgi:Ima1 N-terminal domain
MLDEEMRHRKLSPEISLEHFLSSPHLLPRVTDKLQYTMPPLLRSAYLTCWYCQTKSSQRRSPTLRQWECKSCEAINYLDEVCQHLSFINNNNNN